MLFSTIGQGYVFLWMTAAGVIIGAIYALSSGLRRLLQAGFWLGLVIDCFFGAAAALVLVVALVTGCYGVVRGYALLGALLGVMIFALGAARPIGAACRAIRRIARRSYNILCDNRLIKVIFR